MRKIFTMQRLLFIVFLIIAFLIGKWVGGSGDSRLNQNLQASEVVSQPDIWTCSMHPQIQLSESGQCPICFMDLIPLDNTSGSETPNQLSMSKAAMELAEIETIPISRGPAAAELFLSGSIEFDESRIKQVASWVSGRLEHLYVDYTGIRVSQDDHLVDIYSPELISAQEELLQTVVTLQEIGNHSSAIYQTSLYNVNAAREKLKLLGLSNHQIHEIEQTRTYLENLTIHSPVTGYVIHKNAREGLYVNTGSHIYTIADLSHVWVILDAYEKDLPWLRYSQDVDFTVEAVPGKTFTGKIAFIDPVLDHATRTVKIRVNVENSKELLKPGMFVNARILSELDIHGNSINPELAGKWISPMHPEIIKDKPGSCDVCGMDLVPAESLGIVSNPESEDYPLLIPVTAVLKTGKRAVTYVRMMDADEPVFESREINLGVRAGDFYVVISGVEPGEEVVVNGTFKIDSAMQISAKPSMMNPDDDGIPIGEAQAVLIPDLELPQALMDNILFSYLIVQDLLARDNFEEAYTALMDIHSLTMGVKGAESVMNPTMQYIPDIAKLREVFEELSTILINAAAQGKFSMTVNETYCPMAFEFKGAYWLQEGDQINNPYFGASMLRCGENKRIFNSSHESK